MSMRAVRVFSVFLVWVYVLAGSAYGVFAQDPQAPQLPPQPTPAGEGVKALNPDIAIIGDFLATGGTNDVNPSPVMEMHESEVSFHADIDPYARGDFFLSFGHDGVELEEGYITFPALP